MDNRAIRGFPVLDGHSESIGDERGLLIRIDRPSDDASAVDVENDSAVELALPGGMLGDVGDPEAVRIISVELALDEVVGRGHVGDPAEPRASCEALDSGPRHKHLDGAVAD
jgi:hypothetical protein